MVRHGNKPVSSKSIWFPPVSWLSDYRPAWLVYDLVAGVTLAAYAIPVSLAYAGLAGLPPQVGIYGYLLGGLGYALLGSSRQLAIGPTSAISLMIATTVAAMAEGDPLHYSQIASLTALTVAGLCFFAWLLRLSALVKLISDSILVGFKAGAALTIAVTQLPALLGVAGGGHDFFERTMLLVGQIGQTNYFVLSIGVTSIFLVALGEKVLPGKPVALAIVALWIIAATLFGFATLGVPITGKSRPVCRRRLLPRYGFAMSKGFSRWPLAVSCLPISRVYLPREPSLPSMGILLIRARNSLASALPISRPRSAAAILSQAGYRNPR